jgi:hypothetical protein
MPDTRPPCDLRGIADTTVIVRASLAHWKPPA